jgi:hypothetical protein
MNNNLNIKIIELINLIDEDKLCQKTRTVINNFNYDLNSIPNLWALISDFSMESNEPLIHVVDWKVDLDSILYFIRWSVKYHYGQEILLTPNEMENLNGKSVETVISYINEKLDDKGLSIYIINSNSDNIIFFVSRIIYQVQIENILVALNSELLNKL